MGWWMAGAREMTQEKPQERISEKARVLKRRDGIRELCGGRSTAIVRKDKAHTKVMAVRMKAMIREVQG